MIWKKYNEIQLTKNKMDLNNRKITNHPSHFDSNKSCSLDGGKIIFETSTQIHII